MAIDRKQRNLIESTFRNSCTLSEWQESIKNEQKRGGVALFVPKLLSPREMKNLNCFNVNSVEPIWVECKRKFQSKSDDKMLINITFCAQINLYTQFFDELTLNLDSDINYCKSVCLLDDYNINYLDRFEWHILDIVIISYGLNVCSSQTPERIAQSSETHIDTLLLKTRVKICIWK